MAVNVSYSIESGQEWIGYEVALGYVSNKTVVGKWFVQGDADSGTFTADDNTMIVLASVKSLANISYSGATAMTLSDAGIDGYVFAFTPTSDSVTISF